MYVILGEPGKIKISENLTIEVLPSKAVILNPEWKVRISPDSTEPPTKEST